jgi:hypothetical protein
MSKEDFLKQIAETSYNVGLGAKKHFATLDIVEKMPGFIGFISLVIGLLALYIEELSTKDISATLIIIGIISLYINSYSSEKNNYEDRGIILTKIFNELKTLYNKVKNPTYKITDSDIDKFQEIESRYYENSISKQILFSNWYAHYKFFWEMQIDWINEQKNFSFLRDKLPLSFMFFIFVVAMCFIVYFFGGCILNLEIFNGVINE